MYDLGGFIMALIDCKNFKRIDKERNTCHGKVTATYTVFEKNGDKYFQIDTYGSTNREFPEKISQSLQIDNTIAKEIVEILTKEFKL